ncbi:unnamed protein product [Ambrosiozyma monospora]|uniref:Unnamed protein product n=1 Tax=Ambrosiozyma monospora TaxID=43982 RepID=A0A9W6Z5L1_AMBMO|nr:unnamed protein product [Ambrosiozyma monospora]
MMSSQSSDEQPCRPPRNFSLMTFDDDDDDEYYNYLNYLSVKSTKSKRVQSGTPNTRNVKSHYWKIDSSNKDLDQPSSRPIFNTSFTIQDNNLAVGSNSDFENLRIYKLDSSNNYLTHQSSISLPDIHSLRWLYNVTENPSDMQDFKFLLSGHTQGVVNLTMVPTDQHSVRNAEIIKRFNHAKHITSDSTNMKMTIGDKCTNTIYKLDVTPRSWKSCNMNSLLSIYRENIFFWDTSRSNLPILKNKVNGITSFDASRYQDSLLALSGEFANKQQW